MRRLACLLAVCLPFAALADGIDIREHSAIPFWQRNDGAWESVMRVDRGCDGYSIGAIRTTTNGLVRAESTNVTEVGMAIVRYESVGVSSGRAFCRTNETRCPLWQLPSYTNEIVSNDGVTILSVVEHSVLATNIAASLVQAELPCRLGVPESVFVSLPYADLLDKLPLDYPATKIHFRTGFDGYVLIRFEEGEGRITIKRLLPDKLPYERKSKIRVYGADAVHGGV